MCTLVILREGDKIIATMNRDDSKSRAENPVQEFKNNVLAPVDILSGGTWIGVNKNNVAGFLLNRYDNYKPENRVSRGEIVLNILANGDFNSCENFIKNNFNPKQYQPFTFILLSNSQMLRFDWNGLELKSENIEICNYYFATSSSLDENEVKNYRRNAFNSWLQDGRKEINDIPSCNLMQERQKEDYSIFVERIKVCTLSITQISLNKEDFAIKYFDRREIEQLYDKNQIIPSN